MIRLTQVLAHPDFSAPSARAAAYGEELARRFGTTDLVPCLGDPRHVTAERMA